MFSLISGADAFINFGSTREIMAYMEGAEQTAESAALLQTMRDFTDAVRICRTGNIAPLAKELQTALKNFEQAGAVSFREEIFRRILTFFKREYGSLLKEKMTDLDIIRWCVEKGYFQQAVTLCSEWIPEVIVKGHIFYPIYDTIKNHCEEKKKKYQTWQYYFLNKYSPVTAGTGMDEKISEERALRRTIALFGKTENIDAVAKEYPEAAAKLKPLLEDLFIGSKILKDVKKTGLYPLALKEFCPKTYAILHLMYLRDEKAPEFHLSETAYFKRRKLGRICTYLETLPTEMLRTILPMDVGLPKKKEAAPSVGPASGLYPFETAWRNRQKEYLKMIEYNLVQYWKPTNAALEILHDYFRIRAERNNINQANSERTISTQEVKDLVLGLLQRLESCR